MTKEIQGIYTCGVVVNSANLELDWTSLLNYLQGSDFHQVIKLIEE